MNERIRSQVSQTETKDLTMFVTSYYSPRAVNHAHYSKCGDHLSLRQLAVEKVIRRASTSTVAILMLVALALLTAVRDKQPNRESSPFLKPTVTHVAAPTEGKLPWNCGRKDVGNKTALN